jgi:hypothetical protein
MGGFDFDYWKQLAESDPSAFFRARERYLWQFIARHPDQAAILAALQGRIDSTRAMAGSPLASCRELMAQMEDHLLVLGEALAELRRESLLMHGTLTEAHSLPA